MSPPSLYPAPETRLAIFAEIEKNFSPRSLKSPWHRLLRAILVSIAGLLLVVLTFRTGWHVVAAFDLPMVVGFVAALSGGVLVALAIAPPGGNRITANSKRGLVLLATAIWIAWLNTRMHSLELAGAFAGPTYACLIHSSAGAMLVTLGFAWAYRRTEPFTPAISAMLLGTVAGLIGAAGISAACLSSEAMHLTIGHGLVLPLGALFGLITMRRTLSP